MNKMLKILETVWLVIGFIAMLLCLYSLVNGDRQNAIYFLFFSAAAAIMFFVRRKQRKNLEKNSQPSEKQ